MQGAASLEASSRGCQIRMDRPTVARWRGIASFLVVGSLLASTLAPAVLVAARAAPPAAARAPLPKPSLETTLTAVWPGPEPSLLGPVAHRPIAAAGDAGSAITPTVRREPDSTPPATPPMPGCDVGRAAARPAAVVHHGPRDQKVVALTFDDGWDPGNTMRILATLEHFQVNATFFPLGRAVQLYPSVWQAVAKAGFPIADHSYDHPHLNELCFASQLAQLTRPQQIMVDVLGAAPFDVMRPPYGDYDWNTRLAANAAGDVNVVLWDVDTRDWSGISRFGIARAAETGQEGSIVLMHTFVRATAAALPHIIWTYRKRGFTFVTIGQLLGLGGPVPYP